MLNKCPIISRISLRMLACTAYIFYILILRQMVKDHCSYTLLILGPDGLWFILRLTKKNQVIAYFLYMWTWQYYKMFFSYIVDKNVLTSLVDLESYVIVWALGGINCYLICVCLALSRKRESNYCIFNDQWN